MKKHRPAFTLIELMIVISILLILVTVAVPSFLKYRESSIRAKCIANLRRIQDAREAYYMDNPQATTMENDTALYPYLGYKTMTGESTEAVWTVNAADLACPGDATKAYVLTVDLASITDMPTCANAATHVYDPN